VWIVETSPSKVEYVEFVESPAINELKLARAASISEIGVSGLYALSEEKGLAPNAALHASTTLLSNVSAPELLSISLWKDFI
jgi:hypothetical protein